MRKAILVPLLLAAPLLFWAEWELVLYLAHGGGCNVGFKELTPCLVAGVDIAGWLWGLVFGGQALMAVSPLVAFPAALYQLTGGR